MGKKLAIAPVVRAQVVALSGIGLSQRAIQSRLHISKTAVQQAIHKHTITGLFDDAPRSGRPRKTSVRDDRVLKMIVQKNPRASLPKLSCELRTAGINVSTNRISRRLSNELGLKSYRPAKKPRLSPAMAAKRLHFARQYAHYSTDDWSKIMWTDESTFEQFGTRAKHIRRPVGQRYKMQYTVQTMKHPIKQMIWGAISVHGKAGLFFLPKGTTMNGNRYLNLLKDKLETDFAIHGTTTLMHDGAPCHRAKLVSGWLQSKSIPVLPWPGNSPDLNPIENLWSVLKEKVAAMNPSSLEHLHQCIKGAWCLQVTPDYCKTLIHSMPDRLAAVIAANGYSTKY